MAEEKAIKREEWGSRLGLVLAMAGNAVGIGNFLRFPSKAAVSGGGAFIIPYLCALLFLGIPMMWVEWGIGRHGGKFGHGSTPGMFHRLWNHWISKYLGVIGVALPISFAMYYTYIESWNLSYAYHSVTGSYKDVVDYEMYLQEYQGVLSTGNYFQGLTIPLVFCAITIALNLWVMYRGVVKGIELLAKIAMPLLFAFAIIMVVKVLTLPAAKGTVAEGLAYVWQPDFSRITDVTIWVTAAGQIFYTLSIGTGSLETYASYLKDTDDIVLNGLTTTATNEFVEVIFGGSIAIPATAVFLGADRVQEIASGGSFNLGLVAMPQILVNMGALEIFGTIWFGLLFFAAFTSSVAVAQPVMAFFQDECRWSRVKSTIGLSLIWVLGTIPNVVFLKYGFLDEVDFWAGTLGLVLFAFIEIILFAWIFGAAKRLEKSGFAGRDAVGTGIVAGLEEGWDEMHKGADMKIPKVFFYVMKYLTPVYLGALLLLWPMQSMKGVLNPAPALSMGIEKRQDFKGDIKVDKKAEDESTALKAMVSETKVDHKARVTVSVDETGNVTSAKADGKDPFSKKVEELFSQRRYEPFKDKDSAAPRAVELTYQVEGLYTEPYIWGARGMMLGIYVFFAALTYAVWQRRKREGTA